MSKSFRDAYMSMYAKKETETIVEEKTPELDVKAIVDEMNLSESKEETKDIEKELEDIVAKIDADEPKKVEEAVSKNISVWSKNGDGSWGHHGDYDNNDDAKDDKRQLKDQGEKCVKIIKTDKDKSDWRNSDHREAAIKQLNEDNSAGDVLDLIKSIISVWKLNGDDWEHHQDYDDEDSACDACSSLKGEDDIDDARVVKTNQDQSDWSNPENTRIVILGLGGEPDPVQEETDRERSEYSANLKMVDGPKLPTKGKFTLRGEDGNVLAGTDEHDSVDSATQQWRGLANKKGVKIVKESVNGPVDIMTENALMEAFDINAVGDITNDSTLDMYGRRFNTKTFPSIEDANAFMSTDAGKDHGYLGQSPDGLYHCAHNEHSGEEIPSDEA